MGWFRRNKKKPIRNPKPVYDPTARFRTEKYKFRPITYEVPYSADVAHPSFTSVVIENITINQF